MKEEIESKDKQLARAKQNLEEREKFNEQHNSLYGNSCEYFRVLLCPFLQQQGVLASSTHIYPTAGHMSHL